MDQKSEKPTLKDQGFYQSPTWRRLRRLVLQRDHFLCQLRLSDRCTRFATTVHHVKPLEEYPELALDMDNLLSTCWHCHELTKHRRQRPLPPVRIIRL